MAFPIVAIGASAGGLEALCELLMALPPKGDAAYVVIQHLDPERKSLLPELLTKKTALPVRQITDGLTVEPVHVYVMPPNTTLTLNGGRFQLVPRERGRRHHPVDGFFVSLAQARGDAAIGVVLSGAGADGSRGVQAIKYSEGITFAQTPRSARFPSMPQHAIDTECVDFVLTPREIAADLRRLEEHTHLRSRTPERKRHGPPESASWTDEDAALQRIFRRLRAAHGVDFSLYKRGSLCRRIARRMAVRKVEELTDYVAMLEQDSVEATALYQDFLIRVTSFFRDPQAFERLREQVFPSLIEGRSRKEPLRIWVPGCASGEEVYSLAIELSEYLGERIGAFPIQIFGTDVNEIAIERARAASYLDAIGDEVSEERLKRFFVKEDRHYRIDESLRDLCTFARQDILRDPPFSRLDLVSCRNTLIYFDVAAQRRVMQVFHCALKPRGFLLLGPSESVRAATDLFELLDQHSRLYTHKAGSAHTTGLEFCEAGASRARARDPAQETSVVISEADSAQREADRLLLGRFAPASLVVDEALNILQVRGETGPYLEFASGAPSLNLQRVVRPRLFVDLAPAIQEARQSGAEVRRESVCVGREHNIALVVIPLQRWSAARGFLILFEDGAPPPRGGHADDSIAGMPESEKDRRIAQLERELAGTRDYLQATMDEHESSKEELKSAHEEMLSANEELQCTNEELETAKEELHSANEELTTTNEELRSRNRELTDLNCIVQRSRESAELARAYADAIINTVIEPLIVLDETLTVMRVNENFCRAFALAREHVEGRPLASLESAQWNIASLLQHLHEVLTHDIPLEGFELSYTVPNRRPGVLLVSAHKIPSDAGRTALILLAVEDVTERNLSALRLKEADLRKDEFLAMLAHELRNPLAPITHAMHLLRHSGPRLEPTPLYDLIERQTQRLVRLVDDLLDVARVTRGHIALKLEAVNLSTLVGATVEAYRARVEERGHTLTVELSEAPLEVDGDPIRLEQVVSSLLENAIKYTEPGGRIAVSLREEGSEVILRVRDSGIGIRAQDLEAIFDLFTQLNTSLARTGGGLGIGLTVARRLVMLHGGRIEVLSAGLGHGSEFIIHLPRRAAALARPDSTEDQTPPVTDVPSSRRVLIVDDNADRVDSLALLVRTWGHEVATARDAPTALTVAENFEPDVALLDIGLPGINGYDLARRLRDATHRRPLHLVAMTGYGREEDRRAAQDAGFEVHLVKRPDIDAIRKLLAALR